MNTLLASAAFEDMAKPLISYPKDKYSSALQYVLDSTRILPIKSNPCSPDSDGDGLPDNITKNGVRWTDSYEQYLNIKDPNPLKADPVWQWPVLEEDGKKVPNLQATFPEVRDDGSRHNAIDITTNKRIGLPVVASYDGIVTYTTKDAGYWCDDCYGSATPCRCTPGGRDFGNFIEVMSVIDGKIYMHRYSHLSAIDVVPGQEVTANRRIGRVGSSGSSYGYHLDFSISFVENGINVRKHITGIRSSGNFIDPILFNENLNMYMHIPQNGFIILFFR